MLKRERTKFSKEMLAVCADALMKRLREILTEAQVYELGEEVQSFHQRISTHSKHLFTKFCSFSFQHKQLFL